MTCDLFFGVGFGGFSVEFIHDHSFIANDPAIVARFDHVSIAGLDIDFRAIVMAYPHAARDTGADMVYLAAFAADDRFDAAGPAPSWLNRELSDFDRPQIHDRYFSFIGCAGFIGA